MGASPVLPTWDTFLFAIPFLGLLGIYIFGLDERMAAPKTRPRTRRFFCEPVGKGRSFLSDPDGKPWQKGAVRQIEARFTGGAGEEWMDGCPAGPRHTPKARSYIIEN